MVIGESSLLISQVMVASDPELTVEEARKRFYFVDSQGLVTTNRGGSPLQSHKVSKIQTRSTT